MTTICCANPEIVGGMIIGLILFSVGMTIWVALKK